MELKLLLRYSARVSSIYSVTGFDLGYLEQLRGEACEIYPV